MFTGIITDIGTIASVEKRGDTRARIETSYKPESIAIGASIACNGCCLTVVAKGAETGQSWFEVDYSGETLSKTNLSDWQAGRKVNLERSLRLGDELGGHMVSGHVDGVAIVTELTEEGDSTRMVFEAPKELSKFIAPKGSVVLNGTSLTVNDVDRNTFGVNLIPHTKAVTTWGETAKGDQINLEIDMLARYVARLAEYNRYDEHGS